MSGTAVREVLSLVQPLIDFVYPSACTSCGCRLGSHEEFLCQGCRLKLVKVTAGDALYRETADRLCRDGLFDGIWAPYYFEKGGALQTMIHELKYGGLTRVGVRLGREIGRTLLSHSGLMTIHVAVPIPLHRAKARERGYNQSEYLCRGIAEVVGTRVLPSVLVRSRYTRTQTTLTREERDENVRTAFCVDTRRAHLLYDAAVLLVDDVITTGATMRACAGVLRTCGVRSIHAASIAIAQQSAS